jgi:hypothetical protein
MYELWDAVSGNLLKTYPTEAAALAAVRAFGDAYGEPAAEGLGVIRTDRRGRSSLLAEGAALVALAQRSMGPPAAARAS